MDYRKLGNTDLEVSVICLGTMTWGQQNSEEEGHDQMDYALERGINFFDSTETKKDIDLYLEPGDMFVFYPTLYHSVEPIDPEKPLNWDLDTGRWTVVLGSIDSHLLPNREMSKPWAPHLK